MEYLENCEYVETCTDENLKEIYKSLDLNKNSYCISCNDINYAQLCDRFIKYNIQLPKLFLPREYGFTCEQSHQKILEDAKKNNLPYVIIFEEDAYPCKDVVRKFEELKQHIIESNLEIGIVVLGINGLKNPLIYNATDKLMMVCDGYVCGSHAYIVFNKYYDEVLQYYEDKNLIKKYKNREYSNDKVCSDVILTTLYSHHSYICREDLFIQKNLIHQMYYIKDDDFNIRVLNTPFTKISDINPNFEDNYSGTYNLYQKYTKNIFTIAYNEDLNRIYDNIKTFKEHNKDYKVKCYYFTTNEIINICSSVTYNVDYASFEKYVIYNIYKEKYSQYTPQDVNSYIHNLLKDFRDFMLNTYGGIYVDCHTRCIKCLDPFYYTHIDRMICEYENNTYMYYCIAGKINSKYITHLKYNAIFMDVKNIPYINNEHYISNEYYLYSLDNLNDIFYKNIKYSEDDNYIKTIKNLDLNKNSFCISTQKNIQKYYALCNNFKKYKIKQPCLYNATSCGTYCEFSHKSIIEFAKNNNLPYVIIFEDDAYPCKDILRKFEELKQNILDNNLEVGILVLGVSSLQEYKYAKITDKLCMVDGHVCGAHAYIIFNKYYDEILKCYNDENYVLNATDHKFGIFADVILSIKCCNHSYISIESLFIQRDFIQDKVYITKDWNFNIIKSSDDISLYDSNFENLPIVTSKPANKYALFCCLYDNYNLNKVSLYYYMHLLYMLGCKTRNYDLYVSITQDCYDVLMKIINQEKDSFDTNNVYFNIMEKKNKACEYMLYRHIMMFKNCYKYDIVGVVDTDAILEDNGNYMASDTQSIFEFLNAEQNCAIYSLCYIYDKQMVQLWGNTQFFGGGCTYFKPHKLKSNITKILTVMDKVYNSLLEKPYEFDEFLLTSVFIKDIYENNFMYYCFDNTATKSTNYLEESHNLIYLNCIRSLYSSFFKDLKNYNKDSNTYTLDDNMLSCSKYKPGTISTSINKQYGSSGRFFFEKMRNKSVFLLIRKYMLDYTDNFDLSGFNFNYSED